MERTPIPLNEKLGPHREVFVLLLGPSGVGKSSIIKELQIRDERFKFVSPITDRPLREGEIEKVYMEPKTFTELESMNFFLCVNKIYGYRYGTPRSTIDDILKEGNIPILDFPLKDVPKMSQYSDILLNIYITPPSLGTLRQRLSRDGRSIGNTRYDDSKSELLELVGNHFVHDNIDGVVINKDFSLACNRTQELIYDYIRL